MKKKSEGARNLTDEAFPADLRSKGSRVFIQPIDYFIAIWFTLFAVSAACVAWDQFRNNPEPVMMTWGSF